MAYQVYTSIASREAQPLVLSTPLPPALRGRGQGEGDLCPRKAASTSEALEEWAFLDSACGGLGPPLVSVPLIVSELSHAPSARDCRRGDVGGRGSRRG